MDATMWLKIIIGLVAWVGIPALMQLEEADKHGYLHGMGAFIGSGMTNLFFLFGLIWFVENTNLALTYWIVINWILFILIVIGKVLNKKGEVREMKPRDLNRVVGSQPRRQNKAV